jgi:hypothetical protein
MRVLPITAREQRGVVDRTAGEQDGHERSAAHGLARRGSNASSFQVSRRAHEAAAGSSRNDVSAFVECTAKLILPAAALNRNPEQGVSRARSITAPQLR